MKRRAAAVAMGLLFVASGCSREKELQGAIDDLAALDTAVDATLHDSPNDEGLSKSEALLEAKSSSLHARIVTLREADGLDPGDRLGMACVKNAQTAKLARDYVYNFALKTHPELRVRVRKFSTSLCAICTTKSDSYECADSGEKDP